MDVLPWNLTTNGCIPENEADVSWIPKLLYTDTERVLITIVYPIIFALGIIGNLGFLFVILRLPRMRTVTNVYLSNLAIADFCFLSLAIGDRIGRYFASPISGDRYPIGQTGCILIITLKNASSFASLYLITMVTLEKYYAICRPYQHRGKFGGKRRSMKLAILGWALALCFACTLMPAYWNFETICILWPESEYIIPEVFGFCNPVANWAVHFANSVQTVPFFIALVVNFSMYIFIIQALKERSRALASNISSSNPSFLLRTKYRHQLSRMIVINGFIFFVCLAPFQFVSFAMMILSSNDIYLLTQSQFEILQNVCRTLTYINAAINSFVYSITNERYRKSFVTSFGGCKKKEQPNKITSNE
ncbi:somatostatin receptor type 2-like [Amphiura filiformis]|uniref:somatostatin receptor type 2-like n=1 Tax=Amphiura filiformis TaxID=82378 RepID=UPI003B212800